MTVEAFTIGTTDFIVQALIHICRESRIRTMHQSHMDSLPPVSPQRASDPCFLVMETEIFPVHGEPEFDYSLMDVPCMVTLLALAPASSLLRKKGDPVCTGPRGLHGWGPYLHIRCH